MQPQPFGKYFLLERIATGGMAEIYKAKYRAEGGFEKTLVIKRILPHLAQDEEFISMFRDEARLTVRLSHANIVQVFDFGKNGDDYFLAMEYVQGQNLRQVMKRCQELGAPVPIPFALFSTIEIAKGLAYAHSRRDETDSDMGIVHRDMTPSNVLVSYEGEVKIADFGIAKAASRASGTQAGMIKGKAAYLAPEQVMGKPVDARADLFAVGAVLWEMLVGRKLFTGDSDFEIMNKITETAIQRPSEMNAAIPPEIDRVVMKALDRDPNRRYLNAAAMQKDLSLLLQHFAGSVTTVDISAFLRRLFRKEVEAEREASKSLRMPVFDEAQINRAAADGATIANADRTKQTIGRLSKGGTAVSSSADLPALKTQQGSKRPLLYGILFLFLLGGGALVGKFWIDAQGGVVLATPTQIAGVTDTPGDTPRETPQPTPTLDDATPHETATATAGSTRATPARTATPRSTATPRGTPRATATRATPTPTAVVASLGTGTLKLDSQPWGEIYVDGKSIMRQTPAFDIKLPAGSHEIRLVNSVQKLEATFRVEVVANETVKRTVKLEPKS